MAASANLKTQTQTQPPKYKRRRRRADTSVSPSSSADCRPLRKRLPAAVVSSDSAWCCSTTTAPTKSSPSKQKRRSAAATATTAAAAPGPPPEPVEPKDREPLSVTFTVKSPSPSPFTIKVSPGRVSPLMDTSNGGAFVPLPPSYSKFNSALNAGLLNPMSPPPPLPHEKARSSPTLFQMMASEQESLPRSLGQSPANAGGCRKADPPAPAASAQERQQQLNERAAEILAGCSPGSQFNDPASSDVRLTLSSRDGLSVLMNLHRQILVSNSQIFAAKISEPTVAAAARPRPGRAQPQQIEITDCDDIEVYIETLQLMYCKDLRRRLMKAEVSKVLSILKVSAAIDFGAGVVSCLEHLEAAPWAEEEEEKISSLLSQLRFENTPAMDVLKRVKAESPAAGQESNEEILSRLLQVVLTGRDEKARRDMKSLVAKMLREGGGGDLSTETLYVACEGCLEQLRRSFVLAAEGVAEAAVQIARQADNIDWLAEILIERQEAEEFVRGWAGEAEMAASHGRVAAVQRYEVSRVTARVLMGMGRGQVLAPKEVRCAVLRRWLTAFYDDFAWMRRGCKGLDRHLVEEGLSNTILTLPIDCQQELLMAWFDRFLNSGDDCPNLQRAFEIWWRRAFWCRTDKPCHLRMVALPPLSSASAAAAACDNS